jgi:SpoVK/Ycf46/Vps4 family AAA+-type ATPase
MLTGTPLDENFSTRTLAEATPNLSGSDLKELCRNAAMIGVRQSMRSLQENGNFEEAMKNASSVRLLCARSVPIMCC